MYEKYQNFLPKNFHFFVGKFSVYLNRRVFVMAHAHLICVFPGRTCNVVENAAPRLKNALQNITIKTDTVQTMLKF